ncbi:hypothetical protein BDW59DRAFT_156572 [Aspergillus cavernicola]|uniref:Uncharacterized protein n=1 Tax=Aspergillus cavernicola TaxID=176166 RepID=A0ABR4J161_9EURO
MSSFNTYTHRLRPRTTEQPANQNPAFFNFHPDRLTIMIDIYPTHTNYIGLNEWNDPHVIRSGPPLNDLNHFCLVNRINPQADANILRYIGERIRGEIQAAYRAEWAALVHFTWRVHAPLLVQGWDYQSVEELLQSTLIRRHRWGDSVQIFPTPGLDGWAIYRCLRSRHINIPLDPLVFQITVLAQSAELVAYQVVSGISACQELARLTPLGLLDHFLEWIAEYKNSMDTIIAVSALNDVNRWVDRTARFFDGQQNVLVVALS